MLRVPEEKILLVKTEIKKVVRTQFLSFTTIKVDQNH